MIINKSLLFAMLSLSFLSFKSFALTVKEARDQLKSSTWEGSLFSGHDYRNPVSSIRLHFSYHTIGGTGGSYYELYAKGTKERGWLKRAFDKYILEEQEPRKEKDIEITTGKLKLSWDVIEKDNGLFVEMRFYEGLHLNPLKGDPVLVILIPFSDIQEAIPSANAQIFGYADTLQSNYWKNKNFLRKGRFLDEDIDGFDITFTTK